MTPENRKKHRQERLIALLTEKFGGQQIALANAADISATLVSRYAKGSKGIGEDMAAKIERNTGLLGWFSQGLEGCAEKRPEEKRPDTSGPGAPTICSVSDSAAKYLVNTGKARSQETQSAIDLLMLPTELRSSMPKNVQAAIAFIEEVAQEELERRKKSAA